MVGENSNETGSHRHHDKLLKCCESDFFIHIVLVTMIVLFAGMMSGLTLGLMSMSLVDLQVLAKSGKPSDRRYASKIYSVVKNQHLVLCTLLISNAAAMEALPIFLDNLVPEWAAILVSVTLILLFGEIIPQSVCTRYGLVIGAAMAPVVRVLVWIWFPVAYPISKVLDYVLGKGHVALFRRAELKTLVDFHGNKAGKGGELSHDETTIIAGALELTEKTATDAMTPIAETFSIDINAKLDRDLMNVILEMGHSRIPVYYEQPRNIIGVILAKNLVTINPRDEIPIKNITIRRIPRCKFRKEKKLIVHFETEGVAFWTWLLILLMGIVVVGLLYLSYFISHSLAICLCVSLYLCIPWKREKKVLFSISIQAYGIERLIFDYRPPRVSGTMPLYDILNEFQKGLSHMAVVIQQQQSQSGVVDHSMSKHSSEEVRMEIYGESHRQHEGLKSRRSLRKLRGGFPGSANVSRRETSKSRRWSDKFHAEVLNIRDNPLSSLTEQGEVIGIITMEDVMEELLKEEIYDETDHRNE